MWRDLIKILPNDIEYIGNGDVIYFWSTAINLPSASRRKSKQWHLSNGESGISGLTMWAERKEIASDEYEQNEGTNSEVFCMVRRVRVVSAVLNDSM